MAKLSAEGVGWGVQGSTLQLVSVHFPNMPVIVSHISVKMSGKNRAGSCSSSSGSCEDFASKKQKRHNNCYKRQAQYQLEHKTTLS